MNLSSYQIMAPLVSLIAIMYAWNFWYRQKKTMWEALLWTFFWGSIAFIALKPDVLSYLAIITGIKDQVNAVLITLIGILFFVAFYLVIRVEELSQKQAKLNREIALRDAGFK